MNKDQLKHNVLTLTGINFDKVKDDPTQLKSLLKKIEEVENREKIFMIEEYNFVEERYIYAIEKTGVYPDGLFFENGKVLPILDF